MKFELLAEGVAAGLLLAVMIGPVFFFLLKTSLNFGFRIAIFAALGIVLSDLFCVLLTYFGLQNLFDFSTQNPLAELIGGVVFLIFGISYLIKKNNKDTEVEEKDSKKKDRMKAFWGGFILNLINPSVIIFWIATMGVVISEYSQFDQAPLYFFGGLLATTFVVDVCKAYIATRLRKIINDKSMRFMNLGIGIAMIAMGSGLIWNASNLSHIFKL